MKNINVLKQSLLLQRLALILFAIFPVGLTIISQIKLIITSWNIASFLLIGFLVVSFFAPIFSIFTKTSIWSFIKENESLSVIWVIVLALTLRIIFVKLISTNFVSDMEDVHHFAVDISNNQPMINIDMYPNIPRATHLNMTALVFSFVYKIFGANTATAKLFMVFLGGLTTFFVYKLGKEIANIKVGFVSAFIFAILPSIILYTGVLVGDHLASPLMVLAIFIFARINNNDNKNFSASIILSTFLGILFGLVHWFRPFGIILISATVISLLIHGIEKWNFRRLFVIIVVLIFSYNMTSNLAVRISEDLFQIKVLSASQRIGEFVLKGLNPDSKGTITLEDDKLARDTYKIFGNDVSGAQIFLIQYSFSRLEKSEINNLLKEKFILVWSSHDALFDYALAGSNDYDLVNLMRDYETLLFFVINIFMLYHAIKNAIYQRITPATFIMQLFILGFAILLLIVEVQNRYVAIVIPYSILLGVLGMNDAFSNKKILPS